MKYLVIDHGLNFWKAHSDDKKFENTHPALQDFLLSTKDNRLLFQTKEQKFLDFHMR